MLTGIAIARYISDLVSLFISKLGSTINAPVQIHSAKLLLNVHQINSDYHESENSKCFLSSLVGAAIIHVVFP